jgi:hypothetical protein
MGTCERRPIILKRCAVDIMKVYFKNEQKPICMEIFIHSLKYINTFLISYTKSAENLYMFYSAPRTEKYAYHWRRQTAIDYPQRERK